jgi:hypothetical protein
MASAVASASVAIWAVRSQAGDAHLDRRHDRELAQEARRQERRATAYVDLLTALNHQLTQVERTAPIFVAGTPPEPPPPLGDPELFRLNALTSAFASKDLQDLVSIWTRRQIEFYNDVWYLRRVQEHQQHHAPSVTKAGFGTTEVEQWQKVEATRQDLRDRLRAVGDRVNCELEE